MKICIFLIIILVYGLSFGQDISTSFLLKGTVVDSLNKEAIPFVSISKKRDKKGTISDFDGLFTLENVLVGDSVIFSFVGYQPLVFVVDKERLNEIIYLNRAASQLDEVIVLADNSVLFDMIVRSQKTVSTNNHIAKTYLELETYNQGRQLELFQGYYNGTFRGYNTIDLEMKNGRFALAPISNRIFASTESSKAMYMHKLMESNDYFPISPFELNRRQLQKSYSLLLNSKYRSEENRTIYVIHFEPNKPSNEHFSGNVWIDSANCFIYKVTLQITESKIYPFASIWSNHKLDKVSLELTKTFSNYNKEMVTSSIDFSYDLSYLSDEDSALNISSKAVLQAYNYDSTFKLPYFDFTESSNSDYRRIQMLPYNEKFWICEDEFKLENNGDKRIAFINEEATIKAYQLFSSDSLFSRNFFENPYVTWNGNRIIIKGLSADSAKYYDEHGILGADRYKLKVQLYVDVDLICDSIQVITKTIFDPYDSYFLFENTKENQAFLNIYFDLMELERRKLTILLEQCKKDRNAIDMAYKKAIKEADKMSQQYFKEVQRGTNGEALKKWNKIVLDELTIDNIKLFGVE